MPTADTHNSIGEEPFVIAKETKPLVPVTAIEAPAPPATKRRGFMAGQIVVPDDFDRMSGDEIAALFEERPDSEPGSRPAVRERKMNWRAGSLILVGARV